MKKFKYYYVYQIRNLINNKVYVGAHQTDNLEDGYMGSGIQITRAIKKYGLDNFQKIILKFFDTAEAMFGEEAEIVDRDFVLREDTYNLCEGGYGGQWSVGRVENGLKNARESLFIYSEEAKEKVRQYNMSEKALAHRRSVASLGNKASRTKEAITKKKATMRQNKHSQGKKNSQFGTMWITDGTSNRKIGKNEQVPEGWKRGRRIKK